MKNLLAVLVAIVAMVPLSAFSNELKKASLAKAEKYDRAGYVKLYFQLVWECRFGVCPDQKTADKLTELRKKALKNCKTAWEKDDPAKGDSCTIAVAITPKNFIFRSSHPPPIMEPLKKPEPKKLIKAAIPAVVYVCWDGSQTADPNGCPASKNSRRWLWWWFTAVIFLVMLISILVARSRGKKLAVSLEQNRLFIEELKEAKNTIQKLRTELMPFQGPSDTWIAGQMGSAKGTIPSIHTDSPDTLHFERDKVVVKGDGKDDE